MNETVWNELACEAALCVWEAMLDARAQYCHGDAGKPSERPAWAAAMGEAWQFNGSFGMRSVARHAALAIEDVWAALGDGLTDGIAFDFEYCPVMLAQIDWQGIGTDQRGRLLLGAEAAARAFCEAEQERFAAEAARDDWRRKARRAAGRLWGYPELIDDDPDGADRARQAGEDPAAYVQALGDELGLSVPDPMTLQSLADQYREPAAN